MGPRHAPRPSGLDQSVPSRRPSRRALWRAQPRPAPWPGCRCSGVTPASAQATTSPPPNFPPSISIYQQAYQNWAGMIVIDDVWTCAPASANDVVTLANWAYANGYRLRAKGMSHNWSPILLPSGSTGAGYVLLDTTQDLTSVSMSAGSPATATVGTGVTMNTLTSAIAAAGYGFCAIPAPGDITVGAHWPSTRTAARSRRPARPCCPARPTAPSRT